MKANKKQRRIIKWAVFVFLLATLFPPWRVTFKDDRGHTRYTRVEVSAIVIAPEYHAYGNNESSIASDVLMLEWVLIVVAAGAGCFFLNGETSPASGAASTTPATPAAESRKPSSRFALTEFIRARWVASGIIIVLFGCVIALIAIAIDQAEIIKETRAKAANFKPPPPDSLESLAPTVDQLKTDAEKGQPDAQHSLGWHYCNGDGVIKDYVEAVKWYRRAAEQGYAPAQCSLGFCYGNGFGVPRDFVQAYFWSNLAAAQGQKEAIQNLPIYEKEMRPEQIAEAQRLSREFIPRPTSRQSAAAYLDAPDIQPLTNNPALHEGLSDADIGLGTQPLTNNPAPHR